MPKGIPRLERQSPTLKHQLATFWIGGMVIARREDAQNSRLLCGGPSGLVRQLAQKTARIPSLRVRDMLDTDAGLCCSECPQMVAANSSVGRMEKAAVVTLREVAKESGFSSTTVSIVLNNAPLSRYIPVTTKKRIERAAKKLGYRPNLFARSLRSRRSHTVGVMVFDMTDPYCTPILRGIESTLYQASFLPILTDVHNERSRFERYLEMLLDRRVEALIVVANWLFVEIDVLGDLEKNNIPTVMIGHELHAGSINSVIVDNELGANAAIEHLFSLGHRQIAFIRGPKRITDTAPRWKGVLNFAKAHGLHIDADLVLDLPESSDPARQL